MRTSIALVLFIAVVQLSTIVAFSPLMATKVVAPTKAKAKAKAPAKTKVKAVVKKGGKPKTAAKKQAASKGKATLKARSKAEVKAAAKAKADAKAKANAGLRAKAKAAEKKKADEAAAAKKKALAKAKQTAKNKAKLKTTTSATAARVANSGTDAALAITKNIKKKNTGSKQPLFPGLQAQAKRPESAFKKKESAPQANNVVANKAPQPLDAVNPLEFGLSVAQSEKGQEAIGILIDGGLKFVEAILDEGKKTKVVIPRGFDAGTGEIKKPKITNIGYKQLLDAGIFAGTELFGVAKTNYEKYYVGDEGREQVKVFRTAAKVDKNSGKVLKAARESYYVNIGGERIMINKKL